MPKISVRVVPEASISASMRPLRSAIFLSSVRTSRSISEANRRRRQAEAPPRSRMPRRMRAARWAESVPATPPGTRSRRSPCRRFSALVRSATRSSRLSESRRSTSEAASGSTAASRSLREAAKAVARASTPSFLRALPVESTRTRAESLGGTSTTDSPEAANLPAKCRPRPPAFSTAQRRSGNLLAQRSRDLSRCDPARSRHARGARLRLGRSRRRRPTPCGDRPLLAPSFARTSVSLGPPPPSARAKDIPTSRRAHASFEPLRTPRAPAGRKPRTSQPTLRATGSSGAIPV
jgi:hypothetical protein